MRVLIVSQYFWPEIFRINDVVRTLLERGVEVDVLMCEFNILQKPPNKKIEAVNELMFGKTTVNKVIDFFDDEDCEDLEIKEEEVKTFSYKLFKQSQFSS